MSVSFPLNPMLLSDEKKTIYASEKALVTANVFSLATKVNQHRFEKQYYFSLSLLRTRVPCCIIAYDPRLASVLITRE